MTGEEESEYDDEDFDEDKWQCNGVVYFPEGCKSGQLGFDYHDGVMGYTSPNRDDDFDLCEMCIRWIIHCEKNRIALTWREPDEEEEEESEDDED